MGHITITKVHNGFLVEESCGFNPIGKGQQYVYESIDKLAFGIKELLSDKCNKECKNCECK